MLRTRFPIRVGSARSPRSRATAEMARAAATSSVLSPSGVGPNVSNRSITPVLRASRSGGWSTHSGSAATATAKASPVRRSGAPNQALAPPSHTRQSGSPAAWKARAVTWSVMAPP